MLRLFFITLLSLTLSACAINPATDYRSAHNFSQYKTFAFSATKEGVPESLDSARIKDAVTTQLESKGLSKAALNEADLLVTYRVESETELEQSGSTVGFGFGRKNSRVAFSSPAQYYEREYGKLIIELIDSGTQSVVWQSISQRQLQETLNTDKRTEFINSEVTLMLNHYPPETK